MKDLYGERSGTYYEYGLAESLVAEYFQAKLAFLERKWKITVPGFHEWHSWDENRRKDHVQKFRSFVPGKTDLFSKPRNSGRKPSKRPKRSEPDLIIDRHESNANSDKQQTSSQQSILLKY